MSRMRVIARFSGRPTVPKVPMVAPPRVRPSKTRSASAEAMASGSGSSWIMMRTCSARSKCARSRSTRARVSARSSAGSTTRSASTAVERSVTSPAGTGSPSSASTTTGAAGAARRSAARTRARRAAGTATTAASWPDENARRYTRSADRSPASARPPARVMRAARAGRATTWSGRSAPMGVGPSMRHRRSSSATSTYRIVTWSMDRRWRWATVLSHRRLQAPIGGRALQPSAQRYVDASRTGDRARIEQAAERHAVDEAASGDDVAERTAGRQRLLDERGGHVVAEIGRERRRLDQTAPHERGDPRAVDAHALDAPGPQQVKRAGQELEGEGQVVGDEGRHDVELELTRRGAERDRVVIAAHLIARHLHRFRHRRIDLPRHDRRARLDFGELELAEAGVGTGGEEPQVGADLGQVDGDAAQGGRAGQKRAQAPRRRHRTRRGNEATPDQTRELAHDASAEAWMGGDAGPDRGAAETDDPKGAHGVGEI